MLEKIQDLPAHVFGVRASGEVSGEDLKKVLHPGLQKLAASFGEIYYLLILNTSVQNFDSSAWLQDMLAGIKYFNKWKKMAIVTDEENVRTFTDMASYIMPGIAKGFSHAEVGAAVTWLSTKDSEKRPIGKTSLDKIALVALITIITIKLIKRAVKSARR